MFCYLRRLHYLCIRFAALGNLKVNFHCTHFALSLQKTGLLKLYKLKCLLFNIAHLQVI